MTLRKSGFQFIEIQKDRSGNSSLRLVQWTKGQRAERTLQIDTVTAVVISEAFSENPFPRRGTPEVWFKELSRTQGQEDYTLRLEIQAGKSRQHFVRPCSKDFYDKFCELLKRARTSI